MPGQKGRRRRPDRRSRSTTVQRATAANEPAAREQQIALPSRNARATGFLIAVITGFLAAVMIVDGAGQDGAEAIIRIVIGVLLVALAVVVGALSLFPGQIARRLRRQ